MTKPRFFCIVEEPSSLTNGMLEKAVLERDAKFIPISEENFDFVDAPKLKKGDMLYRVQPTQTARVIERHLMQPGVATLFKTYERAFYSYIQTIELHRRAGVSMPTTIDVVSSGYDILKKSVKKLGGFPVVIKILGASHAQGIIRADSFQSLKTIVDHIRPTKKLFILRQYINFKSHARVFVLGNKVIDSIEYKIKSNGDFRTNYGEPLVEPKKFSKAVQQTAIKATHAMGVEFAGVDILIDAKGRHYMVEANFPSFFARAQQVTGVDTAGKIVDYLQKKARKQA